MKRFQRVAVWLVCIGLILAPIQSGTGLGQSLVESPASLKLLRSDQQAVVLELSTPFFASQASKIGTTGIHHITVPGLIQSEQSGMPELPTIGKLVAVPAGVQVSLNFLADQSQLLTDRYVLPIAPEPARLNEELQPGTYQEPIPATQASPELRSQGYLPSSPAWIAEEVWLRDQRMVRIVFSPFQYDPSTGQLLWHRLVRIELAFSGQENLEDRSAYRSAYRDPVYEPVYRQTVFNYDSATSWRSKAPGTLAPGLDARAASTATRYRIVVDHPGLYRLTYSDLQAAGLPVDQVDPRKLQLTNQGRDVAILVNGEQDGELNPGDEILFYGEDFHGDVMAAAYAGEDDTWSYYHDGWQVWQAQLTPEYFERYTADNVYWLWVQDTPGLRMPDPVSGMPNGSGSVPQVFTDTVRAEQSHRYWSFHFTNQDPWIWDDVPLVITTTRTYTTPLAGVASGNYTAKLEGEILSNRFSSTGSPDHHTWFTVNDSAQVFSEALWDGPIRQPFGAQLPQSLLTEGTNKLHMTASLTDGMLADRITFDWFSIEYARLFQAVGDQLTFEFDEAGGVWEYHISNFSSPDFQVFDITDPLNPQPVHYKARTLYLPLIAQNSSGSGFANPIPANQPDRNNAAELVFQASHPGRTRYLALASPAIQKPKTISAYTPPDLYATGNGADYLIIAPAEFAGLSQSLADYRAAQGLRTMVVDIQDIYNLFNHGIYNPLAIKSFLSYAYQSWTQPAPAFAVLVGDGHWNFKGYSGKTESGSYAYINSPIYMPPYLAWVDPWQGEVDSSNLLAAVAGGDILPDLSIARLPVNNLSQLQAAIDKIIAYESSPGAAWQQRLLFAADNPDYAGNFNTLSETVISQSTPPDYAIDRIYLDTFPANPGAQAAYAITTTLNLTGTLFLNYIGHASISRWAAEGMLVTTGDPALLNSPIYNHIITLDNASRLPVLVSMDCLDGYWNYAVDQWTALAEEMVRAPDKGAVAAYSPTGLGVASGHDILNRAFYAAIFDGGVQVLGPAAIASKAELFATGLHDDLIDTFTIFGDPALRFLTTVAPVHSAQTAAWDGVATYTLQVTNTDVYTGTPTADILTLSAQGNSWPVSFSANNLPLLPGATATIQVVVNLPASPPAYTTDDVEIHISSSRLNAVVASSTLVTTGSSGP